MNGFLNPVPECPGVVLQHCGEFVGRTTNWLYDHLRCIPDYRLQVMCDALENRDEFPLLDAREFSPSSLGNRLWRRLRGDHLYPLKRWWVERLGPKILHSHFGYVAATDLKLNDVLKVPWIVSFYGADIYQLGTQARWQELYGQVFQRATKVLALGPSMKGALERAGCPAEKLMVHALGVDVDSLPACPRHLEDGQHLKVLFAGTFREKKGLLHLVEGAALARKSSVRLHLNVVGDEAGKPGDREYKEEVIQAIRTWGLEQNVTYHSYVSFQDLLRLALDSHIFAAPSITADDGDAEGTPFILQQMMATGMPCIATAHSDIPFIFGEHTDLLVEERDSSAIADRLRYYAEHNEKLLEDGNKLRERIATTFNVRERAKMSREVYDAVCG